MRLPRLTKAGLLLVLLMSGNGLAATTTGSTPLASWVCPIEKGKMVLGEAEQVHLVEPAIELAARIDTGATTSSLGVANGTQRFERDGQKWVRFQVKNTQTQQRITIEKPVVRTVTIKQTDGPAEERPVVKMRIRIGKSEAEVDMSLSNRNHFSYPVLIGRNFISGRAVVDISQRYTQSEKE